MQFIRTVTYKAILSNLVDVYWYSFVDGKTVKFNFKRRRFPSIRIGKLFIRLNSRRR